MFDRFAFYACFRQAAQTCVFLSILSSDGFSEERFGKTRGEGYASVATWRQLGCQTLSGIEKDFVSRSLECFPKEREEYWSNFIVTRTHNGSRIWNCSVWGYLRLNNRYECYVIAVHNTPTLSRATDVRPKLMCVSFDVLDNYGEFDSYQRVQEGGRLSEFKSESTSNSVILTLVVKAGRELSKNRFVWRRTGKGPRERSDPGTGAPPNPTGANNSTEEED